MIDNYASQVDKLEMKLLRFHEYEDLFELEKSTFPEIDNTNTELKQLKNLWDFKALATYIHCSWHESPWKTINAVDLEDQNKQLRKQLKALGSALSGTKGWKLYQNIEGMIDVMNVALPLIGELHSEAMRSRHWTSLAQICNVKDINPNEDNFILGNMISLNLHLRKEPVEDVGEIAKKEQKIENKLKEIENVWANMELEFCPHKDTGVFVP
jgi:dynein heavy chain